MKRIALIPLALLCLAPTAGDVGGCGAEVASLDPTAFALARKSEDCRRCQECGIPTARCKDSCDPSKAPEISLPDTCKPVRHDGEVCLHALAAASCQTYATYVDDFSPSTPSECEFCKIGPEPPSTAFSDGGDQ